MSVVRKSKPINPFIEKAIGYAVQKSIEKAWSWANTPMGSRSTPSGGKSSGKSSYSKATPAFKRALRKHLRRKQAQKQGTKGGAATSRSKGFFRTSKKALRKNQLEGRISKLGVNYRLEAGTVITPLRCGYVGHSTMPYLLVNKQIWRAIIKYLMYQMNVIITNYEAAIPTELLGTQIVFKFRFNPEEVVASDHIFTIVAGSTFESAAEDFHEFTLGRGSEFIYVSLFARDASSKLVSQFRFTGSKIHVFVKSTLKIQNRSKNSAESNEADDVDNVPLYGKSYEGMTNGLLFNPDLDGFQRHFTTGPSNGLFSLEVNTNDPNISDNWYMAEPPIPQHFVDIKKSGKVHLDPAELKTSVLTENFTTDLTKFIRNFYGQSKTVDYAFGRQGHCRFYAFEKMLEVNTGSIQTPVAMNIAFEHDYKIGVLFKGGKNVLTTRVIEDKLFAAT